MAMVSLGEADVCQLGRDVMTTWQMYLTSQWKSFGQLSQENDVD
jgi:hypothetical protein